MNIRTLKLALIASGLAACHVGGEKPNSPTEVIADADEAGASDAGVSEPSCAQMTLGPGDYDGEMQIADRFRRFHLHVPDAYSPKVQTSVVMLFHGFFETWVRFRNDSEMNALSDARGFIAVFPEGMDDSWNGGTCSRSSDRWGPPPRPSWRCSSFAR